MDGAVRLINGLLKSTLLQILICTRVVLSDYCWYHHKGNNAVRNVYCESGCCKDRGDGEDICCFNWSNGVIIGICIGCLAVISAIVIIIVCCYTAKRKRKRNNCISNGSAQPSASVVYAASAGYTMAHPPSAFYPSSQFPNTPPIIVPQAPPAYGDMDYDYDDEHKTSDTQFKFPPYPNTTYTNGRIS